jgi:hypothetical protein
MTSHPLWQLNIRAQRLDKQAMPLPATAPPHGQLSLAVFTGGGGGQQVDRHMSSMSGRAVTAS